MKNFIKKVSIFSLLWLSSLYAMEAPQARTYYDILGISNSASESEIRDAYLSLARIYHPDKHSSASSEQQIKATEAFQKIGEAYEILSNRQSRANYDLSISSVLHQQVQEPKQEEEPMDFIMDEVMKYYNRLHLNLTFLGWQEKERILLESICYFKEKLSVVKRLRNIQYITNYIAHCYCYLIEYWAENDKDRAKLYYNEMEQSVSPDLRTGFHYLRAGIIYNGILENEKPKDDQESNFFDIFKNESSTGQAKRKREISETDNESIQEEPERKRDKQEVDAAALAQKLLINKIQESFDYRKFTSEESVLIRINETYLINKFYLLSNAIQQLKKLKIDEKLYREIQDWVIYYFYFMAQSMMSHRSYNKVLLIVEAVLNQEWEYRSEIYSMQLEALKQAALIKINESK